MQKPLHRLHSGRLTTLERAWLQLDVWQFYLEPSLYGREVPTAGGSRGPGRAYYVPMLSGMQLFRSMASQDEAAAAAGQGSDVFQARPACLLRFSVNSFT